VVIIAKNETKWDNGVYFISILIEKGEAKGTVVNKETSKRYTLRYAMSEYMESFLPTDVIQNMHRILEELRVDYITFRALK
jgi:hypothetical protein